MLKHFTYSALLVSIMLCVIACGGKTTADSIGLTFDTLRVDTTVYLTGNHSGASCHVSLLLTMASGPHSETINDSLLRGGLLPSDYLSLSNEHLTPRQCVDSFIMRYLSDYKTFFGKVYEEERDTSMANHHYVAESELRDGRDGVLNYIAHIDSKQGPSSTVFTRAFNISLSTGSLMTLDSVFVAGYDAPLGELVADRLMSTVGVSDTLELRKEGYFMACPFYAPDNFIMGDDGISFIFVTGEIADRQKGELTVTIPYGELKHLMKR